MLQKLYPRTYFQAPSMASIIIAFIIFFILCVGVNSGISFLWRLCGLPMSGIFASILLGIKWIVTVYFIGGIIVMLLSHFHIIKAK